MNGWGYSSIHTHYIINFIFQKVFSLKVSKRHQSSTSQTTTWYNVSGNDGITNYLSTNCCSLLPWPLVAVQRFICQLFASHFVLSVACTVHYSHMIWYRSVTLVLEVGGHLKKKIQSDNHSKQPTWPLGGVRMVLKHTVASFCIHSYDKTGGDKNGISEFPPFPV